MIPAPRVVYAQKDASKTTRVHTPGRTLPIIIVPDLLGTRLTDPDSGELVWNPKGSPFGDDPEGFKVDVERLAQMSAELEPDETHPYPERSKNVALPKIRHVRSMLVDTYKTLAQKLSTERGADEQRLDVGRALYFCGYDWRQDNARSALRLAEIVDEALEETRERKVVLVGHGMGGSICRYYCRALGGESRVHQLFLLGTPILGTPAAYAALKHGIEGTYPREIIDDIRGGDAGALVFEAGNELGNIVSAATASSGAAGSLFGSLYLLLSLASGKWLSREETRTFVRQMPSMYQLMPGALHCKSEPHWVMFDPLATGVAPTGYMVPLPTVFEQHMAATAAVLDAASGAQHLGGQLQAAVDRAMHGPNEGVASLRASRNAMPLVEILRRAGELQAVVFSDPGSLGSDEMRPKLEALAAACQGFYAQAERTIIDCRNPRKLYEDPYTGLLDAVAERPLCAAMLAQAYRFDDALTDSPREEKAVSLLDTLKRLLAPVLTLLEGAFQSGAFGFAELFTGSGGARYHQWATEHTAAVADRQQQTDVDQRRRDRKPPRAYLHPLTYAIYGSSDRTSPGCLLQPLAFVSRDDSNEVRSGFVPNFIGSGPTAVGDGSVAVASAYPEARLLLRPFAGHLALSGKRHGEIPTATEAFDFIKTKINEKIVDFCKT